MENISKKMKLSRKDHVEELCQLNKEAGEVIKNIYLFLKDSWDSMETTTSSNADILPLEMWMNIFSYLPTSDMVNVALVCKRFNSLAVHPRFWSNIGTSRFGRQKSFFEPKSSHSPN